MALQNKMRRIASPFGLLNLAGLSAITVDFEDFDFMVKMRCENRFSMLRCTVKIVPQKARMCSLCPNLNPVLSFW